MIGSAIASGLSAIGGGSAAAGAMGLAGAAGSLMQNRQARKQAEKANEMSAALAAQRRQDILDYGQKAIDLIPQAYGAQRDVLEQQMNTIPGYLEKMAVPQFEIAEKGSLMGQNTLLSGLGMQNAALLGQPYLGPRMQAQGMGLDPREMASMATLEPIDLSAIENDYALQGKPTPTGDEGLESLSPTQLQLMREMQLVGRY